MEMICFRMHLQPSTFAILIFICLSSCIIAEKISDTRLCADRQCQTLISTARTLARHKSNDPGFLSFERGQTVSIYSKSAGSRQDLWGGELNGKRGYFPRSFVREQKVEIPNPQHIVETEPHVPLEDKILGRNVPVKRQEDKFAQHTRQTKEEEKKPNSQTQTDDVEDSGDNIEEPKVQDERESEENTQEGAKEEVDETEIGDESDIVEDVDQGSTGTESMGSTQQPEEAASRDNEQVEQNEEIDETDIVEDETEISEDEPSVDQSSDNTETKDVQKKQTREENLVDETEVDDSESEKEQSENDEKDDTEIGEDSDEDQDETDLDYEDDYDDDDDEIRNYDNMVAVNDDTEIKHAADDGPSDTARETLKIDTGSEKDDSEVKIDGGRADDARDKENEVKSPVDETGIGDKEEEDAEQGSMFNSLWSGDGEAVVGSFSNDEKSGDATPDVTNEKTMDTESEKTRNDFEPVEDVDEKKEGKSDEVFQVVKEAEVDSVSMDIPMDETEIHEKEDKTSDSLSESSENTDVVTEATRTNDNKQDIVLGTESEDLKFVNDKDEAIEDNVDLTDVPTDTGEVSNGEKLTNQDQNGDSGVDVTKNGDKETSDALLNEFDRLASGISILASETVSEIITDIKPTQTEIPEITTDTSNTEEIMQSTVTEMDSSYDAMYNTLDGVKETAMPEQVLNHEDVTINDGMATHSDRTVDDKFENGAYVIDGTTFDAGVLDYPDETGATETTESLNPSSVVMETSVYTTSETIAPSEVNDVSVQETQSLSHLDVHNNYINEPSSATTDARIQETTTQSQNLFTSTTQIPNPNEIRLDISKEDSYMNLVQPSTDSVQILGTSFSFVTGSATNSFQDTETVEDVKVTMDTEILQNNETVSSDNVHDHIQPSMDPNAYVTDTYISRKPLSEPTVGNEPASVDANPDIQDVTNGIQDVDANGNPLDTATNSEKVVTDAIDNVVRENVATDASDEQSGQHLAPDSTDSMRQGLESTTHGLNDPYGSDEHIFSRKVPDQELDEEVKLSEVNLMKMMEPFLKSLINVLPPSMQTVLEQEPLGMSPMVTMFVTMVTTNVLALLICAGCFCMGKKKPPGKKDPLVVIRGLEENLFLVTKEKENLEDDLQVKAKKIQELQQDLVSQQSSTGTVETDMKTLKLHNEALKKQVNEQKHELDVLKEEVVEKSQQITLKDSQLQEYNNENINLSQRAHDAELALQKTSQCITEKDEELKVSVGQIQTLSEQIQHLETRKQQLQDEALEWSEKVKELSEQVEQFTAESRRMQEDLAYKENELEVLRDCFLQVKAFQGEEEMKEDTEQSPDLSEKLKQMMDVSKVNASLRTAEEERDVIQNKLVIEVESRKELEDQVQLLKRRMETNQTDKMKAERQCQEAQTKLEVLSKYFKEKEAELTRQLGEQEVLKNQNISKLQSSDSFTQELSKENELYRQQVEDLKTEISKAERDFRSQIAANEKKAHENWIATRAAERELKESRHECGMLRQKLTDLERKLMQGPPPGLIRPITHRAMPPPGMMNGPPLPPPDRPGSRGSVHGHVTPRLREDDYRASPVGPDRMPPPDRRLPPGPPGPRLPPPPLDAMSPPPFAIRPPFPPDRRSPPSFDRFPPPPPRGARPPYPRPPPPHLRSPPPSEHDDSIQGQYNRMPQSPGRDRGPTRHQSQV
ncbi:lipoprotein transporter [Mactra antiquata]